MGRAMVVLINLIRLAAASAVLSTVTLMFMSTVSRKHPWKTNRLRSWVAGTWRRLTKPLRSDNQ